MVIIIREMINSNRVKFVMLSSLALFLFFLVVKWLFLVIIFYLSNTPINVSATEEIAYLSFHEYADLFFKSVIFTPLIETLLCQTMLMSLLYKFVKRDELVVLVAAILFAILHLRGGVSKVIFIFPFCLVLCFIYDQCRENKLAAFTTVFSVHALYNFYHSLLSFLPASILFGWLN